MKTTTSHILIASYCITAILVAITVLISLPNGLSGHFHFLSFKLPLTYWGSYNRIYSSLCVIVMGLIALWIFEKKLKKFINRKIQILITCLWILTTLSALFINLQVPGTKRPLYFDVSDNFHYFLMPKYAKELSYFDVYFCSIAALKEARVKVPKWVRRLDNNKTISVHRSVGRKRTAYCKSFFTKERWLSFKQDQLKFDHWAKTRSSYNRFHDQGYNGTPVRTFFSSTVANWIPVSVESLTWISMVNLLWIVAMLSAIALAFDWRLSCLFCLIWCLNYAEHYFSGGAFLRYMWLPSLIIGLCCLKKKKPVWAGIFLSFSALLQVFPVLFVLPIVIKMGYEIYQKRKVTKIHKRFVLSSALMVITCILLSLTSAKGLTSWMEFKQKMDNHSVRLSSGRIGFIYHFIFPKEKNQGLTPYEPKYEIYAKAEKIGPFTSKHIHYFLLFAICGAVLGLIKKLEYVEISVLLGGILFFVLFSTVKYYYAGVLGLPLLFYRYSEHYWAKVYFFLLSTMMLSLYLLNNQVSSHYLYNTLYSNWLTALLLLGVGLFYGNRFLQKKPADFIQNSPS